MRRLAAACLALAGAVAISVATAPTATGPTLPDASPRPVGEAPAATWPPDPNDPIPQWARSPGGPGRGVGAGTSRPPNLLPLPAESGAALQAAVDRARRAYGLDLLVVGVSIDATWGWSGGSGTAPDGVTRLDGDDPFALASVTKTFTAAIVLQLVEERRLGLDDPVAGLVPGYAVLDGVTVRQLLAHRSGVPDILPLLRSQLNRDTHRRWTPTDVLAAVGPSAFPPGSQHAYSNTNYLVLGLVVEAVTGHPYAEELARRVVEPLGLERTGLLLADGAPWLFPESWASAFSTAGSMYATADDLLRWGDALYGGWVLRQRSLEEMLAFPAEGYGLGAEQISVGGHPGYGHSGLLQGFTSLVVHLPGERLTLVVLARDRFFQPAGLLAAENDGPSILELVLLSRTGSGG